MDSIVTTNKCIQLINCYMSILQKYCSDLVPKETTEITLIENAEKLEQCTICENGIEGKEDEEGKKETVTQEESKIKENQEEHTDKPLRCHFFSTFFYTLLSKGGYRRVARWTRQVDLMQMDLVVIPINVPSHWCLAVIDIANKSFDFYDSMMGKQPKCLSVLRDYLQQEVKEKKNVELDYDKEGWKTANFLTNIPRQMNGADCGKPSYTNIESI